MLKRRASLLGVVLIAASVTATIGPSAGAARNPAQNAASSYIVVLKAGAREPARVAAEHAARFGLSVSHVYRYALQGYAARVPEARLSALRSSPAVAFVEPEVQFELYATCPLNTTSGFPTQCIPPGIDRIDADQSPLHSGDGTGSANVNVAVLDSGIDLQHPDLNVVGGFGCGGGGHDFDDVVPHGTFVAGIIGARDNGFGVVGVVPGARLWSVRVGGSGAIGYGALLCGIDFVTSTRMDADSTNDIAVANMSLGAKGSDDGACGGKPEALHVAICNSTAAGVTYVVAAGNSAHDVKDEVPASYDEVLNVTAMGDFDGRGGERFHRMACAEADEQFARFSNFATLPEDSAHTVGAPGACLVSTYPVGTLPGTDYAIWSGTSFSAPHAAGVAALCIETGECAGLTPAQIIAKIVGDATVYGLANPAEGYYGDPIDPDHDANYRGHMVRAAEETAWSGAPAALGVTTSAVDLATGSAALTGESTAGSQVLATGTLPLDPVALAQAKDRATPRGARAADEGSGVLTNNALAPTVAPSWEGQFMTLGAPSDSTGAIGPTRYVQLINVRYGIYDRTGSLMAAGNADHMTGRPLFSDTSFLTDPQMMWDGDTQRFYYLYTEFGTNRLAWGFSKTDSPSRFRGEWCRYSTDFGYVGEFPDYPKMGDTENFLLVGVNVFTDSFSQFVGSDLAWMEKPPAGPLTGCPSAESLSHGLFRDLRHADGSQAFTATPAQQTDSSTTGYLVSAAEAYKKPAEFLSVFPVTENATTGEPELGTVRTLAVPTFAIPPNAPQEDSKELLDTLDARVLNAVSAVDPRFGTTALWTSHAVLGGAGSEQRWYEIDVGADPPTLLQSGAVSDPTLYVFNGAISPDRVVGPGGAAFGSNMVLGFNTSSETDNVAIQMVSKVGAEPQSGFVLIKLSANGYKDFTCQSYCRWGDYSGATPDPAADLSGDRGVVWLTNQWAGAQIDKSTSHWRTWNWAATP